MVVFFLISFLTLCECKTEIGDYIVDCSACNYPPVEGSVDFYKCSVRCEASGKIV